ncbi:MAG: c-type cytochrome [Deltaproteobacteria bacterium]|nr:c-type cytochrome [Deltaproteobacteria bacterium]
MSRAGLIAAVVALAVSGCHRGDSDKDKPVAATVQPAAATLSPTARRERALAGRRLFVSWCSGCHGERGRGDGPAAQVVTPKPRDFVLERLKVRSTKTQPASAQDVFDTITRGLPGTSMPAFGFLTEAERGLLVEHVRALAGDDQKPPSKPMELGRPVPTSPESVARGQQLYTKMGCNKCHGDSGRGDGESAATLLDDRKRPTRPRDLTLGRFAGGNDAAAIHMRLRTGMQGTPMPSFDANMTPAQGWDLANFVVSLRSPEPPLPTDPVARGRAVVERRQCTACHVLEGKGGAVGPSLDLAARKLRYDFVRTWLEDPPGFGKLYPWIAYRMPNLHLTGEEIDGVLALFASLADRQYPEPPPAPAVIDDKLLADGQLLYLLKCTECHNLGNVIPTPEAKRQGPDLINVSRRLRWEWLPAWVGNPQAVYPGTTMVDTNLTPDEIKAVAAFLWKTSTDAQTKK